MVFVQSSSAKKSVKGEDFFVVAEGLECALPLLHLPQDPPHPNHPHPDPHPLQHSSITYNLYAVFDGHGSQAVANYCKTNLVSLFQDHLARAGSSLSSPPSIPHPPTSLLPRWESLISSSLSSTFQTIDAYACERFNRSGSTASVCVLTTDARLMREIGGRVHVLVGNVGDSNVFIDAGETVARLNVDHRLAGNKQEQERIRASGGVVEKESAADCLRLWPGGLMMSRTLGDRDAVHAIAEPALRSAALGVTREFGCRMVIASDGLWDAVPAKMAAAAVRKKKVQVASQGLVQVWDEGLEECACTGGVVDKWLLRLLVLYIYSNMLLFMINL